MILYKRNAQGKPIFWSIIPSIDNYGKNCIEINYGLVNNKGRIEHIIPNRDINKEIDSLVKAKRKEGYKSLSDIYDNSPTKLTAAFSEEDIYNYLNIYLPKFNTHEDGKFIPMLCKTLEDNKPFEKGSYFGQWKINGERCIITAEVEKDLFEDVKLKYRSREGIDWTSKLDYLTPILLPCIPDQIIDMMIEEGVGLDGELYIPGYGINEINSFIKNTEIPQHYQLQYWLYDICIENMSAIKRQDILYVNFKDYLTTHIITKEDHLNNIKRLVLLENHDIRNINEAIQARDRFIYLGFEGLVIRKDSAEYQFGGKRNNSMLKFKKIYDGWFDIINIVPEDKRTHLPKFVLRNDINDETFEATLNAPQKVQENILSRKDKYIDNYRAFVEYRERSGIKQVPFHSKIVNLKAIE